MQLPAESPSIAIRVMEMLVDHGEVAAICAAILLLFGVIIRIIPRRIGPFSGKYVAKFTLERVEHAEEIVARQFFNRVYGTSKVRWRGADGALIVRDYRFQGIVDKHILLARYTCESGNLLDCGVFILRLTEDPDIRAGMYAGLSSTSSSKYVIDIHYTWEKKAL